jgi:hypothetical protein
MVGLEPASQKRFESAPRRALARGFGRLCVVEGESRKVGDLVLPEPVWRALDARRTALELVAPRERRVRVLLDDYLSPRKTASPLARQLPFIEARLGRRWSGVLTGLLHAGKEAELVELLLERYYDPLYRHSEGARRYAARFEASDPALRRTGDRELDRGDACGRIRVAGLATPHRPSRGPSRVVAPFAAAYLHPFSPASRNAKPRSMCGFIGVYGPEGVDVAPEIYEGLLAIQHRGPGRGRASRPSPTPST